MKLPRRKFLHLAAGAAALPAMTRVASALDYPARPVHWIVGYPAGGGTDIFARLMAQSLSERLGQPFVVENRAGASSSIATEIVVRARADGYTLLETDAAAAINATLFEHLNYNFIRDITVIGIVRTPLVMLVHPSVPAKTVPEFIAFAKANPGKISYASGGVGGPLHVAAEMFEMMTDTKYDARALSRYRARTCRPTWRPGAGSVRRRTANHGIYSDKEAAGAGDDDHDSLSAIA